MSSPPRRWLIGAAVATLLAAACGTDSGATTSTTTTSTTTSTTTTTTTTTTSTTTSTTTTTTLPDLSGGDIAAYGSELDGGAPGIVLVDSATGETTSTLVDAAKLGEGAGDLFLDPSANRLYFSRAVTACAAEIVATDVSTGDTTVVTSGSDPVVSPDGRYLAYALDPVCQRHHDIHIRDLTNGSERVWTSELSADSELVAIVTALDWSPNGNTLAAQVQFEDGSEIKLIDATTDGGEIFQAARLEVPDGVTWSAPQFLSDGTLALTEACCDLAPETFRLVAVELSNLEVRLLVDLPSAAAPVDVHPTAEGILLSASNESGGELWAFVDGELVSVATGVLDAAWLVGHGPMP